MRQSVSKETLTRSVSSDVPRSTGLLERTAVSHAANQPLRRIPAEPRFVHDFTRIPAHSPGARNYLQGEEEEPVATDEELLNQGKPDAGVAAPAKPAGGPAAKVACAHPVKPKCTLLDKDLDFGLRVKLNWESSTGKLADLAGGFVTEQIKYSAISNPPFGKSDGKTLPESGKTQRIPSGDGLKAEKGVAQDTHRHPRSLVRSPASKGSYTVAQTYDFKSAACGGRWTSFATYTISYSIVADGKGFRFKTNKTGTDGPFKSDEVI
jgi:hypothetical protein